MAAHLGDPNSALPAPPPEASPSAHAFVKRCLAREPLDRPTLHQLMADEWICRWMEGPRPAGDEGPLHVARVVPAALEAVMAWLAVDQCC